MGLPKRMVENINGGVFRRMFSRQIDLRGESRDLELKGHFQSVL